MRGAPGSRPWRRGPQVRLRVVSLERSGFVVAASAFLLVGVATRSRADAPDVTKLLAGIEDHYNHTQTLRVGFAETWTLNGRKRTGAGTLFLRKPGRMRWEYTAPAGRLFISDGEFIYSYSPEENRAEKIKMKASTTCARRWPFCWGG